MRKYLPEGLSIAQMYRQYVEKYEYDPVNSNGKQPKSKDICIGKYSMKSLTLVSDILVATRVKSVIC